MRDPRVPTPATDLDLSVRLQVRLRDNISAAADMINTIEIMRKQLEDVQKAYKNDPAKDALLKQVAEMDKKLFDVEVEVARAGADDERRQILSAGLPRLHEPDLAER